PALEALQPGVPGDEGRAPRAGRVDDDVGRDISGTFCPDEVDLEVRPRVGDARDVRRAHDLELVVLLVLGVVLSDDVFGRQRAVGRLEAEAYRLHARKVVDAVC